MNALHVSPDTEEVVAAEQHTDGNTCSGDTCSHLHTVVGTEDDSAEQAAGLPLMQRPCGPGMCGAHGMRATDAVGLAGCGERGAGECSWGQLQEVVTATLRLIHNLVRGEVLRGDELQKPHPAKVCYAPWSLFAQHRNPWQFEEVFVTLTACIRMQIEPLRHEPCLLHTLCQRAREMNTTVAICACMVLRQSPAAYRRTFQPCPVVVAYVRPLLTGADQERGNVPIVFGAKVFVLCAPNSSGVSLSASAWLNCASLLFSLL